MDAGGQVSFAVESADVEATARGKSVESAVEEDACFADLLGDAEKGVKGRAFLEGVSCGEEEEEGGGEGMRPLDAQGAFAEESEAVDGEVIEEVVSCSCAGGRHGSLKGAGKAHLELGEVEDGDA